MSKAYRISDRTAIFPYVGFYIEAETLLQKQSPAVASGQVWKTQQRTACCALTLPRSVAAVTAETKRAVGQFDCNRPPLQLDTRFAETRDRAILRQGDITGASTKRTAPLPCTSTKSVRSLADTPVLRARLRPIRGSLNSRSIPTCRHFKALAYEKKSPAVASGALLKDRAALLGGPVQALSQHRKSADGKARRSPIDYC